MANIANKKGKKNGGKKKTSMGQGKEKILVKTWVDVSTITLTRRGHKADLTGLAQLRPRRSVTHATAEAFGRINLPGIKM